MMTLKNLGKSAAVAMGLALALSTTTGCDDLGLSDLGGFGGDSWGSDWGYGGFGPIDDDVFQDSADAWDAYIRE